MLALVGCGKLEEKMEEASDKKESDRLKLNNMLENYYEERLRLFPMEATEIGDHRFDDQFANDISEEHRKKQMEMYSKYLAELSDINIEKFGKQGQLSHDIFKYDLELNIKNLQYNDHLIPINQLGYDLISPIGFIQLGAGVSIHPFKTVRDYENFLKRINGFEEWVNTAIENMRLGIYKGVVQPKIIIKSTIPQLEAQLVDDVQKSLFYNPINNFPENFDESDRIRLKGNYSDAIRTQIIPTYKKLVDFLIIEYLPNCRSTLGLTELPNGKEWYAHRIEMFTTIQMTPDEIFNLGMKEVERIGAEMDVLKSKAGFEGDRKAFYEHLKEEFFFSSEDKLLEQYNKVRDIVDAHIPELFNILPKTDFEIRPIEQYREKYTGAHYQRGLLDGSRPGIFYLNTYNLESDPLPASEPLYLHEAIPGHHFQLSLQMEQKNISKYMRYYWNSGYGEGWALYIECLGKKLGLYTNMNQNAIRLRSEMFRAFRLVVDVGLHVKGWTVDQAIQYMNDNIPFNPNFAKREIERYIAWPGQALSYKIGQIKILELKERVQKKLGEAFDIKAFHDEILRDGAMPLQILESKINNWIEP